eukprot:TRINITY_DN12647_c0_g1_i1.p1 TRINITY_DN12647_c0_g1~~TRINITY_DN12647_c0_g1_i1.p1  ORF type:complete len:1088 (+),score=191.59 TRINITY_DN12647_c0_g1_i1:140-3403(+)
MSSRNPSGRSTTPKQSKKKGKAKNAVTVVEKEKERSWELVLLDTRKCERELRNECGTHQPSLKKLLSTLNDGRSSSDGSLRRTIVEALVPAAAVGHRAALAAQANALTDKSETVRMAALGALKAASNGKRPERGSAVARAVSEAIPPNEAAFLLDVRRASAKALQELAPMQDAHFFNVNTKWMKDNDVDVRLSATQTAGIIGGGDGAVSAIVERLADADWRVNRAAVQSLRRCAGNGATRKNRLPPLSTPQARRSLKPGVDPRRSSEEGESMRSSTEGAEPRPGQEMSQGMRSSFSEPVSPQRPGQEMSQGRRRSFGEAPGHQSPGQEVSQGRRGSFSEASSLQRPGQEVSQGRRRSFSEGPSPQRRGSSSEAPSLQRRAFKEGVEPRQREPEREFRMLSRTSSRTSIGSDAGSSSRSSAKGSRQRDYREKAASAVIRMCLGENATLVGLPRVDAVNALGYVARPGDSMAITAAADRLGDVDDFVRKEAVGAMLAIGQGNRKACVSACVSKLSHEDWRVRAIASEALAASVTAEEDYGSIKKIVAMLETEDWRGRRGVALTLSKFAEEHYGGTRILEAVEPKLTHSDWSIRRKAIEAYGDIAMTVGGTKLYLRNLGALIHDPDEEVRLALTDAIPKVAPFKSKETVSLLTFMVAGDSSSEVRARAIASLANLAEAGRTKSRKAVSAISSALEDQETSVREAAAAALCKIGKNRRCAVDFVCLRLLHENSDVRESAVEAFRGVLGDGQRRERAYKQTVQFLHHHDKGVREAAAKAIAAFASPPAETAVCSEPMDPGPNSRGMAASKDDGADGAANAVAQADPSILANEPTMMSIGPDPEAVVEAAARVVARYRPGRTQGMRGYALQAGVDVPGNDDACSGSSTGSQGSRGSMKSSASKASNASSKTSKASRASKASKVSLASKGSKMSKASRTSKQSKAASSTKETSSKGSKTSSKSLKVPKRSKTQGFPTQMTPRGDYMMTPREAPMGLARAMTLQLPKLARAGSSGSSTGSDASGRSVSKKKERRDIVLKRSRRHGPLGLPILEEEPLPLSESDTDTEDSHAELAAAAAAEGSEVSETADVDQGAP